MLLAPFGRMGVAEAKAMPDHAAAMMASHCPGQPMPGGGEGDPMAVDCMMACAAMAPATAQMIAPPLGARADFVLLALCSLSGIRPEADPPPPRVA